MYVLDTNVFIDAANAYYAFDLAPGYWDFLVQLFDSRHAVSIKSVHDELDDASDDDPLKAWAKQHKQHFIAPDLRVVACYQQVMAWAKTTMSRRQSASFNALRTPGSLRTHWLMGGWSSRTKSLHRDRRNGSRFRMHVLHVGWSVSILLRCFASEE